MSDLSPAASAALTDVKTVPGSNFRFERSLSGRRRVDFLLKGRIREAVSGIETRTVSLEEAALLFERPPGRRGKLSELTFRGALPPSSGVRFLKSTGEYRPEGLHFDTFDRMRKNPQVKIGLAVRSAPVINALRTATVRCDNPDVAAFIEEVFVRRHLITLARSSLTASVFGVAFHEKVWKTEKDLHIERTDESGRRVVVWDGPALVYKKFKRNDPRSVDSFRLQKGTQDFNGYVQDDGTTDGIWVRAWKSFVFAVNTLYNGLWGESELDAAYPYWYYAEFFRALQADYMKHKAVPPVIGYAPLGTSKNQDGDDVDNMTWAAKILAALWDGLVAVLPGTRNEQTGEREWSYQEVRVSERGEVYQAAIDKLETMILRALVVPENVVTQDSSVGSYAMAKAHLDAFLDIAKGWTEDYLRAVNEWVVPYLVEDNFGATAPRATVVANTRSEALTERLMSVFITLLQNPESPIQAKVAIEKVLGELEIPVATAVEIEEALRQQEMLSDRGRSDGRANGREPVSETARGR